MHTRTVLAGLLLSVCAGVSFAQAPPANVAWYNGDCQSGIPGIANWYNSSNNFSRVYDDFIVPAAGWTVGGVFSVDAMAVSGVTQAMWEIRRGVSAGDSGTVVASGWSPATQTLVTTWPDGENLYRIEVDGLRIKLAAGTYWLSVTPIAPVNYYTQSFVCATAGKNATANPGNQGGQAYFYSSVFPNGIFRPVTSTGGYGTSGDYSQGVTLATGSVAAPVIVSVANAASWQTGTVSPGEIVSVFGTGLGPATTSTTMLDQAGKVSNTLDGVQVLFNGVAAPQTYVGSGQLNVVVPYEVAGASKLSVQVTVGDQTSNLFPLTLAAAVPALFTSDGSGTGSAAVLNQDTSYNGPNNPAAKGSIVTLYMTGEGQTDSCVTGKVTTVAAALPLTPQPLLPVTVRIGGQDAQVAFYGEAPYMVAGVMQLNVWIPTTATSGNLPITVFVGATASQDNVTVAVR